MLLVGLDPLFAAHDAGPHHPERSERVAAAAAGVTDSGVETRRLAPRDATVAELARVHDPRLLERLEALSAAGGGRIDGDTAMSGASWAVATRAAGAGLAAVDALARGDGDAAFVASRPPGHHATPSVAMGFCLVNHVAVAARALADRGARVAVVDVDVHHGNGTQAIFWREPEVLYVSIHQWPLYPGTGAPDELGEGAGAWGTCNIPVPAGATGDVYLHAFDVVVEPVVRAFTPDWILVSAGFDAHRADPLASVALTSADFGLLGARLAGLAPGPGRLALFLEGGYDLPALRSSVAAMLAAVEGPDDDPAAVPSRGGPGFDVVDVVAGAWSGPR